MSSVEIETTNAVWRSDFGMETVSFTSGLIATPTVSTVYHSFGKVLFDENSSCESVLFFRNEWNLFFHFFLFPVSQLWGLPYLQDLCLCDSLTTIQVVTFWPSLMVLVEENYGEKNAGEWAGTSERQ